MKKGVFLFAALFMLLFASRAFAQESVWDMANSESYGKKAGGMLGRGLLNVATCFVDVVVHTVQGTQDGPPFVGTLTGLGSGIGCTALRVSSGALDIATFWVPGFNGIPVARSYSNCLTEEDEQNAGSAVGETGAPVVAQQPGAAGYEEPKPRHVRKHHALDYVKK